MFRRSREEARRPAPDLDRTDIPFVTIDPEDARDLDQAVQVRLVEADVATRTVRFELAGR